jgi:adenine/guanine phosphoribosyltransferase-like PRPP-binding protein
MSLRLVLRKYKSVRSLHRALEPFYQKEEEEKKFSYSQFNRYIKGEWEIPEDKQSVLIRFLIEKMNLARDLIVPNLEININETPIQIDLTRLMAYPEKLNLLSFHVIAQDRLRGKFDAILTHSEAIPLAISFSQLLNIPWFSITFRQPAVHPKKINQYPYLVEKELVRTAYFLKEGSFLRNHQILIVSDYIRRGGFIDILFRVAEDNHAEIQFLFAVVAVGTLWKRFSTELEGNIRVIHYV